jgi:hypothetical protein
VAFQADDAIAIGGSPGGDWGKLVLGNRAILQATAGLPLERRPRRGRAAASLHAVGITGRQPDPLRLGPEPLGDDLHEARLVALARRHRP